MEELRYKIVGDDDFKDRKIDPVRVYHSAHYDYDLVNFKTNRDYIFFWDEHKIDYFKLSDPFTCTNKKEIALKVSQTEKNSKIIDIDTAPNLDILAIVIENL